MTNDEIIKAFTAEWSVAKPDPAKLGAYFTDDAVYHNMPIAPINGREAIEKAFAGMIGGLQSAGWETLRQLAVGDTVMNERIDSFLQGEKRISLPVVGVFELRDGKIAAWRDYFDMGAWQRALA